MLNIPSRLRAAVRALLPRSHTPFSRRPDAALILLRDGAWVPGVRVESASYALAIPAVQNALTTMVALARSDVAAVVLSRPFRDDDRAFLHALPTLVLHQAADDLLVDDDLSLPMPGETPLPPFLPDPPLAAPEDGLVLARRVAERALVSESDFPVGCVAETTSGKLVPGVNVEHEEWMRILCAERNALGTLVSYDLGLPKALYLSCPHDPGCSPCGACRQLLAELTPDTVLWMEQSSPGGRSALPHQLLPDFFNGASLIRADDSRDAI